MRYRPFLSYARVDKAAVDPIKEQLCIRGPGGWQDVDDLRPGFWVRRALRRAIKRKTGGFIWYGTESTLTSETICKLEIPVALRRRQRSRNYPFVPLFVGLSPTGDAARLAEAFGHRRAEAIRDLHGVVRGDETDDAFARSVARAYVRDLTGHLSASPACVLITGGREAHGDHDLTLDWRSFLEQGRLKDPDTVGVLVEVLTDIREGLQRQAAAPQIEVEVHLRLPLAVLVGWEWNRVRPVNLTVIQQSSVGRLVIDDQDGRRDWPASVDRTYEKAGPHILAVSVGDGLGETVDRYAQGADASATTTLHVPGSLDAAGIAGLAGWTVDQLAKINNRGVEKHLLLRGPSSLAVRIGAAANGTGLTQVPFWDGGAAYSTPITIGA